MPRHAISLIVPAIAAANLYFVRYSITSVPSAPQSTSSYNEAEIIGLYHGYLPNPDPAKDTTRTTTQPYGRHPEDLISTCPSSTTRPSSVPGYVNHEEATNRTKCLFRPISETCLLH